MAGRAKGVPRDTAITLRLPRQLHDYLREAAAGRSVSEEMRARLERSFLISWETDPKTRELVEAVAEMARNVYPYFGRWHERPYAFVIFKVAIDTLLSKLRPKGEPLPQEDDVFPEMTPEEIGKTVARATIIARQL